METLDVTTVPSGYIPLHNKELANSNFSFVLFSDCNLREQNRAASALFHLRLDRVAERDRYVDALGMAIETVLEKQQES